MMNEGAHSNAVRLYRICGHAPKGPERGYITIQIAADSFCSRINNLGMRFWTIFELQVHENYSRSESIWSGRIKTHFSKNEI